MKFPLAERVVPHLTLSDTEREHHAKTAQMLVDDTIAQYDDFTAVYDRQVDKEQWKSVKTREHLTVYKQRKVARPSAMLELQTHARRAISRSSSSSASASSFDAALPSPSYHDYTPFAPRSTKWTVPTLLMVGSIVGTLDDVMYGVATFDAPSMLLKTTYTHDELVDGEILSEIHGPSSEDPFRFVGIRWIVKGNPAAVSKLVRPRDLVFLEATGICTDPRDGERIGYHLMHSLDLPGFGPLQQGRAREILRGRVSSCIVFKQLANGAVDVYMKANFEPNGKVGEAVAVLSAANGLIYCWRSVFCAQHKKLAWLLRAKAGGGGGGEQQQRQPKQRRQRRLRSTSVSSSDASGTVDSERDIADSTASSNSSPAACSTCDKAARAFRQMTPCVLCSELMCSSCRVTKKISYVGDRTSKQILQRIVPFCKCCISSASQLSAFTVAKDEVVSGMWSPGSSGTDRHRAASVFERAAPIELVESTSTSLLKRSQEQVATSMSKDLVTVDACAHASMDKFQSRSVATSSIASISGVQLVSRDVGRQHPQQPQSHPQQPSSQEQLYLRIAQLRDTAESIYQITMSTSAMHVQRSGRSASVVSPDVMTADSSMKSSSSSSNSSRRVASFRG